MIGPIEANPRTPKPSETAERPPRTELKPTVNEISTGVVNTPAVTLPASYANGANSAGAKKKGGSSVKRRLPADGSSEYPGERVPWLSSRKPRAQDQSEKLRFASEWRPERRDLPGSKDQYVRLGYSGPKG